MSDNLGPVEVDFVIPADFGKDADVAIKKMAGLTDAATKAPKAVKAAILEQKEVIRQINKDITELEKSLSKVKPGPAKAELTQEVEAAKRALLEEKAALKGLDTELDSAAEGSRRLTYQLRDMQDALAKMRISGQQGTEQYRTMELAAAKLSDELNDVRRVTRQLGDDQRTFKGMADGITGLAGAFSAGAGAVGLFAGENENLQKIQTKVQSMMAITIGLQQVSSTLEKDGAFRTVTIVRAKEMWVAAEKGLTAALWGSNVAAKALMGTVTLGLAVAIPMLIGWYQRLTDKQAQAAAAQRESMQAIVDANVEAGKARIELDLTIKKLENFTGSKSAEKRMISEVNEKYGETFGTYKTLGEWLDVLKSKASDYVRIMFLQAKASGLVAKATKFDQNVAELEVSDPADYTTFRERLTASSQNDPVALGEKRKQTAIDNAKKWRDYQLTLATGIQKEIDAIQNKSGINTSFEEKPGKAPKAEKADRSEEEKTYYLDLLAEFKTYQEQRVEIQQLYDAKIAKLTADGFIEKAEAAKQSRDQELKALDDEQPINKMLEKYKTYDQQIKDIRTESDKEITALKEKGYNEQADVAARLAQQEIEAIELQKLKTLSAFEKLFEDVTSLTGEQIKAIIDEANQNLADLNPAQLKLATEQIEKLGAKLDSLSDKVKPEKITDPFLNLADAIQKVNDAASDTEGEALGEMIKVASAAAMELLSDLDGVVEIMTDLGIISQSQADSTRQTFEQISGVVSGAATLATGIIDGDPAAIIKGGIELVSNGIKLLDVKGKKIAKEQSAITSEIANMERAYAKLNKEVERAVGTEKYTLQREQYKLNADEMAKYQELIDLENKKKKKKRDQDAINEWKDAMEELEGANIDIENAIMEDLAQTNAKDFANDIANAIVGAFDAGTDATLAWGEVVDQVFRNAIINALKLKYLEPAIAEATEQTAKAMEDGIMTAEEAAGIRAIIEKPAQDFEQNMEQMFEAAGIEPGDSGTANTESRKASFSTMKEETGSALLGQFTALRMSSSLIADYAREDQNTRKLMLSALVTIAENTNYCRRLETIDNTLKSLETDGIKIR